MTHAEHVAIMVDRIERSQMTQAGIEALARETPASRCVFCLSPLTPRCPLGCPCTLVKA